MKKTVYSTLKNLVVFFMLLVSTHAIPQNTSDKAKALLDEVYAKVKGYQNIFIDFKYVLDNTKEKIHQETRGDVTLQGEKYLFNYLGSTKMYDGKKIYTVVPENEEVIIENKDAEDESTITPSKMLTFYKAGYRYQWDILQNIKGRNIQYIKLTPISTKSDIQSILLGIDVSTKHIYNLIETGKNGVKTTITVNTMKTNEPLPKNLFIFNQAKYEEDGYYIIKN